MPLVRSTTPVGVMRAAVGAVLLARPALLPRMAGVDSASADRTAWIGRMLGAREVVLGVGAVSARRAPAAERRRWVAAGIAADAADVAVVVAAARAGRVPTPAAALLAGLAALAIAGQVGGSRAR